MSPDGRWVAYQTNESGRFEIVVQAFPDAGGKWQVSTGGGVAPRWLTSTGATFEPGAPVALFSTHIAGGGTVGTNKPQYAVARDSRFLINQPVEAAVTPITLILNWNPARAP